MERPFARDRNGPCCHRDGAVFEKGPWPVVVFSIARLWKYRYLAVCRLYAYQALVNKGIPEIILKSQHIIGIVQLKQTTFFNSKALFNPIKIYFLFCNKVCQNHF